MINLNNFRYFRGQLSPVMMENLSSGVLEGTTLPVVLIETPGAESSFSSHPFGLFKLFRELLQGSCMPLPDLLDLGFMVFGFLLNGFLQFSHLLLSLCPGGSTKGHQKIIISVSCKSKMSFNGAFLHMILPQLLLCCSGVQSIFQFSF